MDNKTLRKVQLTMLEIAKEVKRICEENHINYFMDSGTLIGAVRHKGFIPWDDDMDFAFLRPDYEKFIEVARTQLKPGFILQTWDTDPYFPYCFAKVLKEGTVYLETSYYGTKKRNELYVDLFVLDVYPDSIICRKKQGRETQRYKHILMMQCVIKPWRAKKKLIDKIMLRVLYLPYNLLAFISSRESIKKKYLKARQRFNGLKPNNYYNANVSKYGLYETPASCFESFCQLPFEDTCFMAPGDSDLYLKNEYGDYMTPPPIEEREGHHNVIEVKL